MKFSSLSVIESFLRIIFAFLWYNVRGNRDLDQSLLNLILSVVVFLSISREKPIFLHKKFRILKKNSPIVFKVSPPPINKFSVWGRGITNKDSPCYLLVLYHTKPRF